MVNLNQIEVKQVRVGIERMRRVEKKIESDLKWYISIVSLLHNVEGYHNCYQDELFIKKGKKSEINIQINQTLKEPRYKRSL